jgi:hypothetical protein
MVNELYPEIADVEGGEDASEPARVHQPLGLGKFAF